METTRANAILVATWSCIRPAGAVAIIAWKAAVAVAMAVAVAVTVTVTRALQLRTGTHALSLVTSVGWFTSWDAPRIRRPAFLVGATCPLVALLHPSRRLVIPAGWVAQDSVVDAIAEIRLKIPTAIPGLAYVRVAVTANPTAV
jgi:hypothetical protein